MLSKPEMVRTWNFQRLYHQLCLSLWGVGMWDTKCATAVRRRFSNPLWGCFLFLPFLNPTLQYSFFSWLSLSTRICVFSFGYFDSADLVSCLPLEMLRCLGDGEDESVNIQRVRENHSRKECVGSREDRAAFGNSSALEGSILFPFLPKFLLAAGIAALSGCCPFFPFRKTLCPV